MSSTTVYGCDWCKTIVGKDRDDKPKYAASVTLDESRRLLGVAPVTEEICVACRDALEALRMGRYKR